MSKKHTREFKLEAVRLCQQSGVSAAQVARELGVAKSLIYKWRTELEADSANAFPGKGRLKPLDEENKRLQRELARVTMERDILKKATAFFAKESR